MGFLNSGASNAHKAIAEIIENKEGNFPDAQGRFDDTTLRQFQGLLNDAGFQAGSPDGDFGPSTSLATLRFLKEEPGMVAATTDGLMDHIRSYDHLQTPAQTVIEMAIHDNMNVREGISAAHQDNNTWLKSLMVEGGYLPHNHPINDLKLTDHEIEAYQNVPEHDQLSATWNLSVPALEQDSLSHIFKRAAQGPEDNAIEAQFKANKDMYEYDPHDLPITPVIEVDTPSGP